ncbi:MAG: Ada metal-binding domain-containing protein [Bacteroidota bacterium]
MRHKVMWQHINLGNSASKLIRKGQITLAGNGPLKIFGTLHCRSGRKMKRQNRVFFRNEAEALQAGYRPCGHCQREKFLIWKRAQEAG